MIMSQLSTTITHLRDSEREIVTNIKFWHTPTIKIIFKYVYFYNKHSMPNRTELHEYQGLNKLLFRFHFLLFLIKKDKWEKLN